MTNKDNKLNKIIWSCWWQGLDNAPRLVRRCVESWIEKNPEWEFRCLDSKNVRQYCDLPDLKNKTITAPSLSDILRISLLHEYGGIWVDATLFCNIPLENWIYDHINNGFFAFSNPSHDRLLSSWFLACYENNILIKLWYAGVQNYWTKNSLSKDYFWFHHLFGELYESNTEFFTEWEETPKINATGPHSVQNAGMFTNNVEQVDWAAPVFKLTHRYNTEDYKKENLAWKILETNSNIYNRILLLLRKQNIQKLLPLLFNEKEKKKNQQQRIFASLKTKTENLGDHIQIISGLRLLSSTGIKPNLWIDRDDEIKTAPLLKDITGKIPILINGWFKTNRNEWPPNDKLIPLYFSFHIRLHQCPELISKPAIKHYKKWSPIGCRDQYTYQLLTKLGVESFISQCLSLTIHKRKFNSERQKKTLIISRDKRILDYLPDHLENTEFISHYTNDSDFNSNLESAEKLLKYYQQEAKLIITTMLHAANPAIASGIPVIVFYPKNNKEGHISDKERFSSLSELIGIYNLDNQSDIDWKGKVINIGKLKLTIREKFYKMIDRWHWSSIEPVKPIAPTKNLPPY